MYRNNDPDTQSNFKCAREEHWGIVLSTLPPLLMNNIFYFGVYIYYICW